MEYLSAKNIEFLNDMKKKDGFYSTYRETVNELNKLREAHGVLISLIRNHHLTIDDQIIQNP